MRIPVEEGERDRVVVIPHGGLGVGAKRLLQVAASVALDSRVPHVGVVEQDLLPVREVQLDDSAADQAFEAHWVRERKRRETAVRKAADKASETAREADNASGRAKKVRPDRLGDVG